jgi:hypothetical protein
MPRRGRLAVLMARICALPQPPIDLRITRSFGTRHLPAALRSRLLRAAQDVLVVSRRSRSALLLMCPQCAPADGSGVLAAEGARAPGAPAGVKESAYRRDGGCSGRRSGSPMAVRLRADSGRAAPG